MRKSTKLILLLILVPMLVSAQRQNSDEYETEFIWGINKNTAGGLIGGLVFRKSFKIDDKLYKSFGLEIMNVKHPQESQRRSNQTANSFIYGKKNYLYALRFQYGRELILFRKAPQQGVEIKLNAAVGPSLGLLAPYYVELNGGSNSTVREPFNSKEHLPEEILGSGFVLQGIHQSKLRLGLNLKTSISFELGTSRNNVTGFEIGALLDAYTQKIELLANDLAENRALFPTAFITLFYGTRR